MEETPKPHLIPRERTLSMIPDLSNPNPTWPGVRVWDLGVADREQFQALKSLNLGELNSKNQSFVSLLVAQLMPPGPGMDFQDNPNINPIAKEHFHAFFGKKGLWRCPRFPGKSLLFPPKSWIFPASNPHNPRSGLSVSQMSSGCSFPEGLEMGSKGFLGMSRCAVGLAAWFAGSNQRSGIYGIV